MLASFGALLKRYSQWPHRKTTESPTVCTRSNKEERRCEKTPAHTINIQPVTDGISQPVEWSTINQFDTHQCQSQSLRPIVLIWCCCDSSCSPRQISGQIIFQLDSTAVHSVLEVINFLANNFAKRWRIVQILWKKKQQQICNMTHHTSSTAPHYLVIYH